MKNLDVFFIYEEKECTSFMSIGQSPMLVHSRGWHADRKERIQEQRGGNSIVYRIVQYIIVQYSLQDIIAKEADPVRMVSTLRHKADALTISNISLMVYKSEIYYPCPGKRQETQQGIASSSCVNEINPCQGNQTFDSFYFFYLPA